jgi:dCMP deaminase
MNIIYYSISVDRIKVKVLIHLGAKIITKYCFKNQNRLDKLITFTVESNIVIKKLHLVASICLLINYYYEYYNKMNEKEENNLMSTTTVHLDKLIELNLTSQFSSLNRYGWIWRDDQSIDINYLTLAQLLARNSNCIDGNMGCLFVKNIKQSHGNDLIDVEYDEKNILICTINTSLFSNKCRSDVHAEANAISEAARCGLSLSNTTCYVTLTPCKNCYKLLQSSGISRIVSRTNPDSEEVIQNMKENNIEYVTIKHTIESSQYIDNLAKIHQDIDLIKTQRHKRKLLKIDRQNKAKLKKENNEII